MLYDPTKAVITDEKKQLASLMTFQFEYTLQSLPHTHTHTHTDTQKDTHRHPIKHTEETLKRLSEMLN